MSEIKSLEDRIKFSASKYTELLDEPVFQEAKYIQAGGGFCPFCESENYQPGKFKREPGGVFQELYCSDCKGAWADSYVLTTTAEVSKPGGGRV